MVLASASIKVIHSPDLLAAFQQSTHQRGSDEAGGSGHEIFGHIVLMITDGLPPGAEVAVTRVTLFPEPAKRSASR